MKKKNVAINILRTSSANQEPSDERKKPETTTLELQQSTNTVSERAKNYTISNLTCMSSPPVYFKGPTKIISSIFHNNKEYQHIIDIQRD